MLYKKITNALLFTGLVLFSALPAYAGNLNEYVADTADNVLNFPQVIAFLCYMGGFVLIVLGVNALRQHTENPNSVPLKNPLAKLGFGGIFMALPPVVSAVQATFGTAGNGPQGITGTVAGDGTLGGMIDAIVENTWSLPNVVSFIGYLMGFLLIAAGVYKLKNHIEFGPQSVPLTDPLKYIFTGGAVMSLPLFSEIAFNTFGDQNVAQDISWDQTIAGGAGTPGTLDDMMIRVMANTFGPVTDLFVFFCYVAGVVLMLIALHRFTKSAQEGPRGPTGFGTIVTFVLAGVFFSIAPMVGVMTETLFGGRDSYTEVAFLSIAPGAAHDHARRVTIAVLAFLIIVGILSIIRGFFVLRGVAEGNQQMTMMSGISHVVAGAILVNFGQFANIIQKTLGVDTFGVLFN